MSETALLERIASCVHAAGADRTRGGGLAVGIGDDAAGAPVQSESVSESAKYWTSMLIAFSALCGLLELPA